MSVSFKKWMLFSYFFLDDEDEEEKDEDEDDEDEDIDPDDREDFNDLDDDLKDMVRDGDLTIDEAKDLQ